MNKRIILLIIVVLLLISGIGTYLIYNNDSTPENNFNTSKKDFNQENISNNKTEVVPTNKYIPNYKSSHNNIPNLKTITSKSDVIKEAKRILNDGRDFYGKNAVVKNVKYHKSSGLWSADFVDSKTGKYLGYTYIEDSTGEVATM